jgi:hypothetical protein
MQADKSYLRKSVLLYYTFLIVHLFKMIFKQTLRAEPHVSRITQVLCMCPSDDLFLRHNDSPVI